MNYPDVPEGYGPSHIPFQPTQQPDPYVQRPVPSVRQPAPKQPTKQQGRMPKAQALALVRRMKQGIIVGSLLCFGTVTGLIINQTSQASAQQTTKSTSSQTTSQGSAKTATAAKAATATAQSNTATQTATAAKAATATSQNSAATQTATTSQQGGGYGFGSTQAGQPVSGSHTS